MLQSKKLKMFECEITTPFGMPVLPDVNMIYAGVDPTTLFEITRLLSSKVS